MMNDLSASTALNPSPSDQEAALVRMARRGNEAAFAALYQAHASSIFSLAWRLSSDRQAAEDITQETFLRMFRFLGGLKAGQPVRPWLKQVASRLAIDRLRRAPLEFQESIPDIVSDSESAAPDIYGEAVGLLEILSPIERTVVLLNQMEGWTHQDISKQFGKSESWSKSLVSRALTRLRQYTQNNGERHHE